MDALTTNRTWQPSCSHGTYQHKAITSRSRQLLMMGTWLPETCWASIRREIKGYKKWHLVGFSYPHWYRNIVVPTEIYCRFTIYRIFYHTTGWRLLGKKFCSLFQSAPFLQPPCRSRAVAVGCTESHPWELYRQIFQQVLHKQCFERIGSDILWEDDGEDKDDSDWLTGSDSVTSDDGESDE